MIARIFAMSVPTKPLNDAQMRGAFFCIYTLLSKYANGKITALHETLYGRDRLKFIPPLPNLSEKSGMMSQI